VIGKSSQAKQKRTEFLHHFSARQHRAVCYPSSIRPSARLSVRHTGGSVKNGYSYYSRDYAIFNVQ